MRLPRTRHGARSPWGAHDVRLAPPSLFPPAPIPGVFKRTHFLPASAYLRFFLSSNRVPERESYNQAYIVSR